MTKLTIRMPDNIADAAKDAAGDNVSGWITRLVRDELLRQECEALAAWDRDHRDPAWDAQDEAERGHAR
jgi:hypothetical protein